MAIVQEPKAVRRNATPQGKLTTFAGSHHRQARLRNFILNRTFRKAERAFVAEKHQVEDGFFSKASMEFTKQLGGAVVERVESGKSINDKQYVEKIARLKPDVIAVMGTSLLRKPIIAIPKLGILNMHTGLSPYYRGGFTNLWPIINKEPQYCGVTIHQLTPGIDSGGILYHGLPNIEERDSFPSINCKAIILGANLMVQAIKDLVSGEADIVEQWFNGKLFNNRNFNGFHAYRYSRLMRKGYLKKFAVSWRNSQISAPKGLKLLQHNNIPQYIPQEYR